MGKLIEVSCPHCKSEWLLRQGYGLMHGRAETVAGLFPDDIRKKLPVADMESMETEWSFSSEPALCRSCKAFVSVSTITVSGADGPYIAPCPSCGGRAEPVAEDKIALMPCPVCEMSGLEMRDAGLWD